MKEEWKDIYEVDSDYQISNHGRVKSKERYVEYPYRGSYRRRLVRECILKAAVKKNREKNR